MLQDDFFCDFSDPQEHCMLVLIYYNAFLKYLFMIHCYDATLYFLIHVLLRVPILSYHPYFLYPIPFTFQHSGTLYILFYTYYRSYIFITSIIYLGTLYLSKDITI